MTQEIQVILTLEVDITLSKSDIEQELNSRLDNLVKINSIKEESEIYETE